MASSPANTTLHPCQQHQQQLQSLYQQPDAQRPPLILDVRPEADFLQRRLAGAVSIPLAGLTARCYLIPDKATAFAVVLASPAHYTVVTDQSQHGSALHNGSTAVYLKGATSLPDFFSTRGWSVSMYLRDVPDLWAAAEQLSVLEQGRPADLQQLARRGLFAPSGLLAASIDQVEAALTRQQQQQGPKGVRALRALDVGCGSGRDVAWLASRMCRVAATQPVSAAAAAAACSQAVHWHVTGVDEWLGALERAADLAAAMRLGSDRVCLAYAKICPETGAVQQLQVPGNSKLSTSPLAARAAGMHGQCGENSSPALAHKFDLILCCRFLVRALLPQLANMLLPGAFICYCTFVDLPSVRAFGRPAGPEHLLQPGELASQHFGPAQGFEVLQDDIVHTPDGREVCWFVARKH